MKKITIEKFILTLAAAFAAYNFGLAGGYIEGTKFSVGGVIAGVVVNISLAIASSRYGSLNGKTRTRQATVAFVVMLVLAPAIVAPVVFYRLPETFLGVWWLRAVYSLAYALVADMAIVAMGAVSGKTLIALSEQTAAGTESSAPAVRNGVRRSADAVRDECAALAAQYSCTEAQCGWSPSVDALVEAARAGKSARNAAASAKAGHAKNKHPKALAAVDIGWPGMEKQG